MDLLEVAETSRYVVAVAMLIFLGSWVAFCAEAGVRSRLARSAVDAPVREAELVGVAKTGSSVSDQPDVPGASPADTQLDTQPDTPADADRLGRIARLSLIVATAVLAVGVAMRGIGVERMPWGNMYEFSITGALVGSVALLALTRRAAMRTVSVWAVLLLFITLGMATTILYVAPGPLVPALRSYWLVIHVGAAVTAFGLFTISAVFAGLQIVAERAEKRGNARGFVASLPSSSTLDRLSYRLTAVAFPIWTAGPLILGAIWAEVSWGRYWGWDPKEVWALITWLAYAAFLHARATAGWKGSKASIVSLIGFGTLVFSYFGVNLVFNGLHSYGGL